MNKNKIEDNSFVKRRTADPLQQMAKGNFSTMRYESTIKPLPSLFNTYGATNPQLILTLKFMSHLPQVNVDACSESKEQT